jgi:hypothetical protein
MYSVFKHQNITVLRDQLHEAYPEANILTIVGLLKSGNKNKVKLVCDGKVPSYIKHNALKPQRPTTHIPQPTMCSRCHGYDTGICNKTLACQKCGGKHDAKSCTSKTKSCPNCKGNHSSYYKGCPYYKVHSLAMTIHAQESKSYADCLKQSWNTSRVLTQEKTRPSQPTKSANKEATSNLPIGELVNTVIQLVEVGLAEFDPVKAVTAAKKMRANVAEIFGELVKAPSKEQTEAKSTDKPTPRPRPNGKNTRGTQGKGTQPQATPCTSKKNNPPNTKSVSPTPGRKRQRSPGNEDEESPCHKQVIVVEADVEPNLSDPESDLDFSLLVNTPSKEAMVCG